MLKAEKEHDQRVRTAPKGDGEEGAKTAKSPKGKANARASPKSKQASPKGKKGASPKSKSPKGTRMIDSADSMA